MLIGGDTPRLLKHTLAVVSVPRVHERAASMREPPQDSESIVPLAATGERDAQLPGATPRHERGGRRCAQVADGLAVRTHQAVLAVSEVALDAECSR